MKPIIGISVDCQQDPKDARSGGKLTLNWNYAEAVAEAGGVPILIPPTADMAQVAEIIDGWLIPGGDDIDAKHFGEQNHPKVELQDPARFEAESRLYRAADSRMPIFGICYGCQFVNVVRGGSLYQHLPEVVGHENHTGGTLQEYQIDRESKIASIVQSDEIKGKSYHHQAINRTGQDLQVVARNEDGTIEAIEGTDRPW
jgi:putative glutamine amidotransferase